MQAPGRRESRNGWRPSGKAGVAGGLPDRVVHGVVERLPVGGRVRPDECRHDARERRRASQLRCCELEVLLRKQRGTEQLALTLAHVIGQPVVVGTALRVREFDVFVRLDAQELGGIEHRHVDVVGVHVVEPRLGVVRRGPDLGVAQLAPHGTLAVLVAHAGGAGDRGEVGGAPDTVPHQPFRAVGVGLDVPDPVPVLLRCVVEHAGRVLENVPVGVDETQLALGGHGIPLRLRRRTARASCETRSTRAMLPRE